MSIKGWFSFHIWHFYKGVWIWQERFLHLISQIDINLFSMMFPFKWLQIMLIALPFATVCLWLNCTLFVQMKPYHCHLHLIQLLISSKKCMLIIEVQLFLIKSGVLVKSVPSKENIACGNLKFYGQYLQSK